MKSVSHVVLIFGAALFLSACDQFGQKGYPEEVKNEFLKSCVNGGADVRICGCVLDKLEKEYPLNEFAAQEAKLILGTPDETFIAFWTKSALECRPKD